MRTPEQQNAALVRDSIAKAKALLGTGWAHVSLDVQIGLVSSGVLSGLAARIDDQTSTQSVALRCGYATEATWMLIVAASQSGWVLPAAPPKGGGSHA